MKFCSKIAKMACTTMKYGKVFFESKKDTESVNATNVTKKSKIVGIENSISNKQIGKESECKCSIL